MRIIGKCIKCIQLILFIYTCFIIYSTYKLKFTKNHSYLITSEKVCVSFDEIKGIDSQKNWILKLLQSNDKPNGLLLYGPPGTGKTMIAKAIATKMSGHFINVSPSLLQNKFYGETPKIIEQLFKKASSLSPCIIFFDEMDGLLTSRSFIQEPADRVLKTTLLSCMDGLESNKDIFLIGATNRLEDIDQAILRRFRMQLEIPYPDTDTITSTLLCDTHEKILPIIIDKKLTLSDINQLNKLVKIHNDSSVTEDTYMECLKLFF